MSSVQRSGRKSREIKARMAQEMPQKTTKGNSTSYDIMSVYRKAGPLIHTYSSFEGIPIR